jgi:hypothetical protein
MNTQGIEVALAALRTFLRELEFGEEVKPSDFFGFLFQPRRYDCGTQ